MTTIATTLLLAHAQFFAQGIPPFFPGGTAQVPDAVNAFIGADDVKGGTIEKGVLLCRVDIVGSRGWDTFGAVDMAVTITMGKHAPVTLWGPEDRSSAVVTVPAVSFAAGDKLSIVIEDRDVTETEFIARGRADYKGTLPLRIELDDVLVQCRAIDRATAVARSKSALTRAAHGMTSVERATPDLRKPGLGEPDSARWEVGARIHEASAWIGADDPQVVALRAQLDAAEAAFHDRARQAVREMATTLPAPAKNKATPILVPMDSLGLDAHLIVGPGLVVEVTVPAHAGEPMRIRDDDIAARITLLDPDGREIERAVSAVPGRASEAQGVDVAPGASRKIRMRASGTLPALVRVDGVIVRIK